MVKRIIIFAICISFIASSTAYAGFGVHKNIDPNSDICTGCHRQHMPVTQQGLGVESAFSATALATEETSEYEFCITCHGPDATGADTDIVYGVYKNVDNPYGTYGDPLNGGGFTKIGGLSGQDITSTHAVDGGTYEAFGESMGSSFEMTCSTCHDPDGSSNYRILKDTVNGKDVSGFVTSNETNFETGTTSMPKEPKGFDSYIPNYTDKNYKKPADVNQGMSGWCSSCHNQYMSAGNTYTDSSGKTRFHHGVNVAMGENPSGGTSTDLPLAKDSAGTPDDSATNYVECLTCHAAHGSSVQMTDNARVEPTRSSPSSGPGYSALLRLDNRGVCQNCHKK